MNSLENQHKAEISELHKQLAENKARSREMENSLRQEVDSLKHIIRDLESRLGIQPVLYMSSLSHRSSIIITVLHVFTIVLCLIKTVHST